MHKLVFSKSNRHLDWNDLRIVVEVARSGSIKRAASQLKMSESTVSRHVLSLEQHLGADLFERMSNGMLLTKSAEQLINYLFRAENELEIGLTAIREHTDLAAGVVQLATAPLLANYVVAPAFAALQSTYQNLELELITSAIMPSMERREVDLVITSSLQSANVDALTRRLCDLDYGVFIHKGHRGSAHLEDVPWITYGNSASHLPQAKWIENRVQQTGEKIWGMRCNDEEGMVAVLRSGVGKTLLPRCIAANMEEMEEMTGFHDMPKSELWLLAYKSVAATKRVRIVMDWLIELITSMSKAL